MRDPRTGKRFSARSTVAGEAYALAVDRILGSESGVLEALDTSLSNDPRFCMALAARYMLAKQRAEVDAEDYRLRALAALEDSEEWERSHISALFLFLDDPNKNLAATENYVSIFGYDLLVIAQLCTYLIAHGGATKFQRVQHILESADSRMKTDWAYLARLGFAVSEAGDGARGLAIVERALEQRTSSLYVIHAYAHVLHGQHSPERCAELLRQWLDRYNERTKDGAFYSHIFWHLALSEWECGNGETALSLYRRYSAPDVSSCAEDLKLADAGGFLLRTRLRKQQPIELTEAERALCAQFDSKVGDPSVALHVGAILLAGGDGEGLVKLREKIGPASNSLEQISHTLVTAFIAFLQADFQGVCSLLDKLSTSDRLSAGGNYIERVLIDLLHDRAMQLQES